MHAARLGVGTRLTLLIATLLVRWIGQENRNVHAVQVKFGPVLWVVITALVVGNAQAADRFVSTTGSDTANDCLTSASPCRTVGYGLTQAASGDTVKAAYQDVLEQLLVLLQADLEGRDARGRALTLVTLCIGGLVAARNVADSTLARELREAAYRQAQTVLKARPC